MLEIGPATGKATRPLAERGLRITCVELGAELAARARAALAEYPDVEVAHGAFEDWRPASGAAFDLVVAATSWHWIDPGVRYERAFDLLRDGGHLAFWKATHVFPDGGDPFFRDIQDVYDEIGEGMLGGPVWPRPGELPDERAEIEATGLFDSVHVGQYDWEVVYDADGYIDLLETFSGHISMEPWQRERLYAEIRQPAGGAAGRARTPPLGRRAARRPAGHRSTGCVNPRTSAVSACRQIRSSSPDGRADRSSSTARPSQRAWNSVTASRTVRSPSRPAASSRSTRVARPASASMAASRNPEARPGSGSAAGRRFERAPGARS